MPAPPSKTPAELLATPVQFLKGVGPYRAEQLARLDLHTARDVLFFFPRDYQDLTDLDSLAALEEDKLVRLRGEVLEVEARQGRGGRTLVGALVGCEGGRLRALWFNLPYMQTKLAAGQHVLLAGKARRRGGTWEMVHPTVRWLEDEADEAPAPLLPVYPLTEGLNQAIVRRIVRQTLDACVELLDEVFPPEFLEAHRLWPLRTALREIHFPRDRAHLDEARRRFVYQELFILQLALAVRRHRLLTETAAPPLPASARIDARIMRLFPFEWTAGQRAAVADVARDMARPHPMNRLLQGDVGSGKTVVAVYALLLAVAHQHQGVLMAPTEVLARQHAETLAGLLAASRVRWALLVGGLPAAERRDALDRLARGELDVVIGTQAVLHEGIQFHKLGVVVIDEQHKFGVLQRAKLRQAGVDPHYLVMTATPIPRTVAMTLFGDLDVSVIRDRPAARAAVHTYLAGAEQRAAWWDFFRRKLREGRQGYVIVPVVEDAADGAATASLLATHEALRTGPLADFRLDVLHGRLGHAEKQRVMEAFRRGETQVLVATTVVEVGVDVPNASLMTIESAERFGLSQLHQLRGRIGRGGHPGYCCVFADPATDDSRARLDAFVESTDGFALAEVDFRLRGPGDLLGTRQHGLPPLRIADPLRDQAVLDEARRDAQQFVAADPGLARPEHARLRRMLLRRYGEVLELGDVG